MIRKEPLVLHHELTYALNQLEHSKQHVFISGKAGTGKSTLLSLFRNTSRKRIAVVAPTGVAALNVRGQTIHSFFKIPPRLLEPHDIHRARDRRLYQKLEILIIDEISMVRADLFDILDYHLRLNRDIDEPFGGVRIILFGDLYQLPPVVASQFERQYLRDKYGTPYFFSSHIYQEISQQMETIELTKVYRQNERHFINLLDVIRTKQMDFDDLEAINERVTDREEILEGSITLTTRNDIVRKINALELNKIDLPSITYTAKVNGRFDPRVYPTDLNLILKNGAQVMMVRNDPNRRFVNGSIGKIISLSEQHITVEIYDDDEKPNRIELEKQTWEMIKYEWHESKNRIEATIIGTFDQWPLKLAWAMTIHKSQGKPFNRVYIDMGRGAFEYGQTYVALSRCTHLEGVQLKSPLKQSDILVDDRVTDFYNYWR
jgi:ATP-dependent exoDNAse (exonuclease V) alpha subunit